jgi:alpha-beta hydrolase superfamily lysophospholipase
LSDHLKAHVVIPEIPGVQYDWGRTAFKKGEPKLASEDSYCEAAEGAFDYVKEKFPECKIIVYGQSLGTGAACETATRRTPHAVILQSPLMSAVRGFFFFVLDEYFALKLRADVVCT